MPRIDFPQGTAGFPELPKTKRLLQNCFNTGDGKILPRPGLSLINTTGTGKVARGQFVWNGALYQVASDKLLKVTNTATGAFVEKGQIRGSNVIVVAEGFNEMVIVVKSGPIYTLDRDDLLSDISNNPHVEPSIDVAFIDGRFVYVPSSGDPVFFSDVGDAGSVQPLSFFDPEELPDRNSGILNLRNTLYIGGENSFELFKNTGGTPNPFTRISGSRVNGGLVGGIVEYGGSFLFIGREKDQSPGVYGLSPGGMTKISNDFVDALLVHYSQEELRNVIANRFRWSGYEIASFVFPESSLFFMNGNWIVTDCNDGEISLPWCAGFITEFEGEYFSTSGDNFGRLSNVNTDFGKPILRVIETAFEQEDNDWMTCQSVGLGISQGFNENNSEGERGAIGIAMSRDNVIYSAPLYREAGSVGQYSTHLDWTYPGGLGSYDGFMGVRITTTGDLAFACDHLVCHFR